MTGKTPSIVPAAAPPRFAVLGVGAMGSTLIRVLCAAGFPVTMWNRTPDRCLPLLRHGALPSETPVQAIGASDIAITCFTSPDVTLKVLATEGVDGSVLGRTIIEVSVGNPASRLALARWCAERGVSYLGGAIRAFPGDVGTRNAVINLWGQRETYDAIRPALESLGVTEYLSADIAVEEALAAVGPVMSAAWISTFMEAGAYLAAHGVPLRRLIAQLASTYDVTLAAAQHGVDRIESVHGGQANFSASIQTWESSVAPLVDAMRLSGVQARTSAATIANFRAAINCGKGESEIHALIDLLRKEPRP